MAKKLKLSAIVLLALVSATPAQAGSFDWFQGLFGVGSGGDSGTEPTASTTGAGSGGDPGVDPE